jgi:flavin reductase (DIM6/NTAB) family NADH-FMN oxidoreductase RutF
MAPVNWRDQRPDDAMVGAFDAYAPPSPKSVAAGPFREAMSRIGAAVHIITTNGPAGKGGFTATAVCSVSDDPPTLLVCVNRKSQTGQLVTANGVFCVNTLGAEDEELSNVFAGRGGPPDRFASSIWGTLATGAPVLTSVLAACDCRVTEINVVGSHNVIFGVVEAVWFGQKEGSALVYHDRGYKQI